MIKDMTEGKPAKVLLMFSLPMLLSTAFQQLYNIADSMIAGRFVGSEALAAIGVSFPVTMLFLAVALGASVGSSVIVSQYFGTKRIADMKTSIWTGVISIMSLSIVLTGVGLVVCRPVIKLLKTPSEIVSDAAAYLFIYIWGLPFLFLYNSATAIFNGLGDSRTPLFFLIFSSVFNVVLDIVFVTAVNLGVKGVAWATFIAQGLSGVLAMITLMFRLTKIRTEEKFRKFDWRILGKICSVAVPSILQQSFISVGQLCVQGLINSFGAPTIAGYSAAIKINIFCIAVFNTMSNALSSYTAQNTGAGKYDRVKQGYKAAMLIITVMALVFVLVLVFAGKYLVSMFVSGGDENSDEVLSCGKKFLYFVAAGYPVVCYKVVTDGLLRGSGYMTAFMFSTFSDLVVRVGASFAFASLLGFTSVCMSFPVGWVLGALVSMAFYLSGKWKNKVKV